MSIHENEGQFSKPFDVAKYKLDEERGYVSFISHLSPYYSELLFLNLINIH